MDMVDALVEARRSSGELRVAVDIDQTLAWVHPQMFENYNRANGTSYTIEHHVDWDFVAVKSDYMEMMPFYAEVWKTQWKDVPLLGDVSLLRELSGHYEVNILTTRSPSSEGVTGGTIDTMHEWLRMHKLDDIPVVICDPKQDKALHFDYHVYIDDSPRLAKNVENGEGKLLLLVDQKYNKDVQDGQKVIRVGDVNEGMRSLIIAARVPKLERLKAA